MQVELGVMFSSLSIMCIELFDDIVNLVQQCPFYFFYWTCFPARILLFLFYRKTYFVHDFNQNWQQSRYISATWWNKL